MSRIFAAAAVALAALTLAPPSVTAQGVKGGDRQAIVRDGTCTDEQRTTIRRGFADARRMSANAIAVLSLDPASVREHTVRFFGTNPAGAIAKNFRAISQGLDEREGRLIYECNRAESCRNGTFAYVRWGGGAREVMGVCPAFFRADRTGQDSQGGIIVHEMSHLALHTQDHAYQPRGAQALAKDDPRAAQMNADSYEYFAEFLPR